MSSLIDGKGYVVRRVPFSFVRFYFYSAVRGFVVCVTTVRVARLPVRLPGRLTARLQFSNAALDLAWAGPLAGRLAGPLAGPDQCTRRYLAAVRFLSNQIFD